MIVETARVIELDGDYALVESERRSSCGGCSVRSGCGTGALSQWLGKRSSRIPARNGVGACVGDAVQIGIPERVLVSGSLAVYAVPLVLMILSAVAGTSLPIAGLSADAAGMLGGALGLAAGFIWLRGHARRVMRAPANQPTILRVLIGTGVEMPARP